MPNLYLPEGRLLYTPENKAACSSLPSLRDAAKRGQILEGKALLCSAEHDLLVSLGPYTGRIPKAEAAVTPAKGTTREIAIISKVGKPVSFVVTQVSGTEDAPVITLSRRRAQELALRHLMERVYPGTVLPATVTHLEPFGAFVDIGCGLVSMIGIDTISISRIPHPNCRFFVGQDIFAVVTELVPSLNRVNLSHKELLGTWSENAAAFSPGMTVAGYVRGIKEYGAFVELTPNLSGLAEVRPDLAEGDRVSVYIKGIFSDRMKVKLLVISRLPPTEGPPPLNYFITKGRLARWRYAPDGCKKTGARTDFEGV